MVSSHLLLRKSHKDPFANFVLQLLGLVVVLVLISSVHYSAKPILECRTKRGKIFLLVLNFGIDRRARPQRPRRWDNLFSEQTSSSLI